jgi:hypothetical protein
VRGSVSLKITCATIKYNTSIFSIILPNHTILSPIHGIWQAALFEDVFWEYSFPRSKNLLAKKTHICLLNFLRKCQRVVFL